MTQMDTRQHDLLPSSLHQLGNLSNDLVGGAAAQSGPYLRNNAKCAVEHTAVLHLDKRPLMTIEAANAPRQPLYAQGTKLFRQARLVGDDLAHAGQPPDTVRVARRITTHDNNFRAGL